VRTPPFGYEQQPDLPRVRRTRVPLVRYRSPSLWWPDDRSWCVASDVDVQTTYIGASADCVARLLADDELEALPITASQSVRIDADTINPQPTGEQ
jgi:hypothetical protein